MEKYSNQLEERRQESIVQAKLNCHKVYLLHKYGVKSLDDCLLPYTAFSGYCFRNLFYDMFYFIENKG